MKRDILVLIFLTPDKNWEVNKFYKPLYDAFKFGTLANVVKHFLSTREISKNFIPENPSLKTNFLEEMSKAGGHPILPEVENNI